MKNKRELEDELQALARRMDEIRRELKLSESLSKLTVKLTSGPEALEPSPKTPEPSAKTIPPGRLWLCSICKTIGPWGLSWQHYSSIAIDEADPACRLITCGAACRALANKKLECGKIVMPTVSNNPIAQIAKGPKGYPKQPEQAELAARYLKQ